MCIFCDIDPNRIINHYDHWFAIYDDYPVTELHTLIILKQHVESFLYINNEEIVSLNNFLKKLKFNLQFEDSSITGFNIGINDGISAGQTIMHCHVHLIPRRNRDVVNPRGGVRHIIPGKGFY